MRSWLPDAKVSTGIVGEHRHAIGIHHGHRLDHGLPTGIADRFYRRINVFGGDVGGPGRGLIGAEG